MDDLTELRRQTGYDEASRISEGNRIRQISRVCHECDRLREDELSPNYCGLDERGERIVRGSCVSAIKNGVPGKMTRQDFTPNQSRS